jgi:pimeloyl-ACP methyl ester carboxylesterase
LRGHGLSEAPHNLNHLTIKDLAKDLYAVIKALKVERAVLIGFSMSVQLIFEFYKMHPECVAGLIPLLGTYKNPLNTFLNSNVLKYLFPYMHKHFQEKERLWRVVWKLVFKAPFFFSLGKSLGLVHEISKRADLQPYFDHLANIDLRVFLQMVEFMDEHSAEDVLPNIKVPTLLIGAEKDSFTPFYIMEEMHRFIPDSQLLKVPLASHGAAVEFPELINLRIEKFLKHLKGHPQKIQKAIRRITRKAKGQDSSVSPKGSPFPNL